MKKLIGTVVLAALAAGAAFAELNIGMGFNRALWTIGNSYDAANDETKIVSDLHQGWGGNGGRVGISFSAKNDEENLGVQADFHINGKWLTTENGTVKIWAKPAEWMRVVFAYHNDDNELRSDIVLPLWGWDRIGIVNTRREQEGWIFPSVLNKNVCLVFTPVEGLTIGGGIEVPLWNNTEDPGDDDILVNQLGRKSGLAAAYTIEDIGTIKVGVQGQGKKWNKDGELKDRMEIDAAFEFNAIEGFYAALGAGIPVGGSYNEKTVATEFGNVDVYGSEAILVTLGAGVYMIDNLSIQFRAGFAINSYYLDAKGKDEGKEDGKVGFLAEAAATYSFDNGISVFGDLGYANDVWMEKKDGCFTFGLGIDKGFSNGSLGIAFEGATNGFGQYQYKDKEAFAWCVPIRMQAFF